MVSSTSIITNTERAAAVAEGEIPQIRYENYCLLYDELKNQRKY